MKYVLTFGAGLIVGVLGLLAFAGITPGRMIQGS